MILGREIPKEQAQKLLTTGKTGLLESFISKRGRPFSAYLKLDDGKVGFEFSRKNRERDGIKIANSLLDLPPHLVTHRAINKLSRCRTDGFYRRAKI